MFKKNTFNGSDWEKFNRALSAETSTETVKPSIRLVKKVGYWIGSLFKYFEKLDSPKFEKTPSAQVQQTTQSAGQATDTKTQFFDHETEGDLSLSHEKYPTDKFIGGNMPKDRPLYNWAEPGTDQPHTGNGPKPQS